MRRLPNSKPSENEEDQNSKLISNSLQQDYVIVTTTANFIL